MKRYDNLPGKVQFLHGAPVDTRTLAVLVRLAAEQSTTVEAITRIILDARCAELAQYWQATGKYVDLDQPVDLGPGPMHN